MNPERLKLSLAKAKARKIIKDGIRAQGFKVSNFEPKEIEKAVMEYLKDHPKLMDV